MRILDGKWIEQAIQTIMTGICDKLEKDGVKVYRVGDNIIRMDVNIKEAKIGGGESNGY